MNYREKVTISIGLPTYNRAALLPRAIESVLAQTFPDFELIVIDDGSTDNTKEVIESFCDARIRYIRHEIRKGLMASRNTALSCAGGTYLAFQDSDDWWDKEKLEKEVALLREAPPMVGAVYSRMEKRYHNGTKETFPAEGTETTEGNLLPSFLGGGYLVTLQALLMRRECLEKVGMFDEHFSVFGDAEFIIRFAAHYEFLYNPVVRVHLEVQADSISRNKKERLAAREYIFIKHRELFKKYPLALRYWASILSNSFARNREWKKSLRYLGIYCMSFL